LLGRGILAQIKALCKQTMRLQSALGLLKQNHQEAERHATNDRLAKNNS